jgi:hypothetical protein
MNVLISVSQRVVGGLLVVSKILVGTRIIVTYQA